ncbi:MAG: hypothetical protein KZY74_09685, partial [Paenibacillaceae bacterium]|nr:hypothetical protein [Paenibacillaceae bacterium]
DQNQPFCKFIRHVLFPFSPSPIDFTLHKSRSGWQGLDRILNPFSDLSRKIKKQGGSAISPCFA